MKHPVDTSQWGEFVVGELFDVQLSDGDNKPKKLPKGDIPLVSAGNTNNGVVGSLNPTLLFFQLIPLQLICSDKLSINLKNFKLFLMDA